MKAAAAVAMNQLLNNVADARLIGALRYFTGIPCKHGHIAERQTVNSTCMECARIKCNVKNAKNPDANRARASTWYANNREKGIARSTVRTRRIRKDDPEASRVHTRNYQARMRNAGGRHTALEIKELYDAQGARCANPYCGCSLENGYQADHIVPISCGGANWIANIQLLCAPCNHRKSAKDNFMFLIECHAAQE